MPEFSSALTQAQWTTILVVYGASVIPTALLTLAYAVGKLPKWLFLGFIAAFVMCAAGWEIWFTYGLWDGLEVDARRSDVMNYAIPQNINWILNSLADASTVCMGGLLLVWLILGRSNTMFERWRWDAFFLLLLIYIGQNLYVELFIYHEQLAMGYPMSWAPLVPTGPWFNPVLFEIGGRSVQLQSQISWLLMTPLFYGFLIYAKQRWGND
jgi:hypothetical protein